MKVPPTIQLVIPVRDGDMIRVRLTEDGQEREVLMPVHVAVSAVQRLVAALTAVR